MVAEDFSPYLQKLLAMYDEKRKRFQWAFSLLLGGTIAFYLFIFLPYLTLLGNRADCLARQGQCTALETSILENRFTEVVTSWGNIPLSTSEVVVLFPVLTAMGVVIVFAQLITLMRLRRAIQKQPAFASREMDVTLIAPILLDPQRGGVDLLAGAAACALPPLVGLYSINLIYVRLDTLRNALPYIQAVSYYHTLYLLSVALMLVSSVRLGIELWRFLRR